MMKYWKINHKNPTLIVLVSKESIYKGKINDANQVIKQLENNQIPSELFEIPFSYIRKIQNQVNKNQIKIFFGNDSEEEIIIKNHQLKEEIFKYLIEVIPKMYYSKEKPSFVQNSKPQLFALLFTTIIFIWSLYYAIQIENGVQYELRGRAGLLSIIFSIGLLGTLKLIISYLLLIGIILFTLIKKNKSIAEIEQLTRV